MLVMFELYLNVILRAVQDNSAYKSNFTLSKYNNVKFHGIPILVFYAACIGVGVIVLSVFIALIDNAIRNRAGRARSDSQTALVRA